MSEQQVWRGGVRAGNCRIRLNAVGGETTTVGLVLERVDVDGVAFVGDAMLSVDEAARLVSQLQQGIRAAIRIDNAKPVRLPCFSQFGVEMTDKANLNMLLEHWPVGRVQAIDGPPDGPPDGIMFRFAPGTPVEMLVTAAETLGFELTT